MRRAFAYVARDRERNSVGGELELAAQAEIADLLIERGLIPIRICGAPRPQPERGEFQDRYFNRPTLDRARVFFCRQMYARSPRPASAASCGLQTLGESMRNPLMRRAVGEMRRKVEEGRALSGRRCRPCATCSRRS